MIKTLLARFAPAAAMALALCLAGVLPAAHAQNTAAPTSEAGAPAAAPAAPAPAAAAAPAPATTHAAAVKVDNPYGIGALWAQSDAVTKAVLAILVIMSMSSWYVIVMKLFEQSRMGRQAKQVDDAFWNANSVKSGAEQLATTSPFRFIADAGVHATKKHDGLRGKVDFADFVDLCIHRATERVQRRLSNGMSLLATVGSTSPFVGLFGTVWGIYHALTAIGVAGQASIDKVAGPVGEALIMTAIGLAVAVPAVLGYNWLLRRNVAVMDDVREFSGELHSVILAGSGSTHA
ncbi:MULTISPECIES: MotA/TolQ/ExbB proton channel family protein [unclassified Variovorax]|uniref:MotA/TolQ/ExbB proton channel family protein n=1 Tax=unclassified Variovorax TaxID=663243 RepID=UPI002574E93C|nr:MULTISPECIES: MotA/TolQ/ExbB proton channel family protein [unclassified Variovorax]MDM0091452.1 MotA/TolQ/ExbB proton channel family protein [Variovorax sp. J22G40]MDM0149650.1 MotA/TolQ/ExbB proton channel family protein [Variovorax sp. J2P1-31]